MMPCSARERGSKLGQLGKGDAFLSVLGSRVRRASAKADRGPKVGRPKTGQRVTRPTHEEKVEPPQGGYSFFDFHSALTSYMCRGQALR